MYYTQIENISWGILWRAKKNPGEKRSLGWKRRVKMIDVVWFLLLSLFAFGLNNFLRMMKKVKFTKYRYLEH